MNKIKDRKVSLKNIYLFIYIFSIIILSRNTMISSCVIGFEKSLIISGIISIPLVMLFIKKMLENELSIKKIKKIIPLYIIIIISVLIKRDWQLYNISVLFYITIAIFLATLINFEKFKESFVSIIFFLAVFSLITTYVVKPILIKKNIDEQLLQSGIIVTNSSNNKFLNLGFGFAYFTKDYIRNYGIFTEPSYYQFYLTIAILIIMFFKKKRSLSDYIKLCVLILTMISTVSSVAIVILALIFIIQFINLIIKNKNNVKKLLVIFLVVIIISICLIAIKEVRDVIEITYQKITTKNESSDSRYGSVVFTLENLLKSPIIGNKISDILPYEKCLTNTTITIAAIYGVFPCIYSLVYIYMFSKQSKEKFWIVISIFCIILLSCNSHMFLGVGSFWVIILSTVNLNRKEIEKHENTLDS